MPNKTPANSVVVRAPQDVDAEKKVLAYVLSGEIDAAEIISLGEAAFYSTALRDVYIAIETLSNLGRPVNRATVLEALHNALGVPFSDAEMDELIARAPENKDHSIFQGYLESLKRTALRREIYYAAARLKDAIAKGEIAEVLNANMLELAELQRKAAGFQTEKENTVDFLTIAKDCMEHSAEVQRGEITPSLATGFIALDNTLTGLHMGTLNIIAARPSVGKTVLALNIVRNVLQAGVDKPVLVFSLEMSLQSIGYRMISSLTKRPYTELEATTDWQGSAEYNGFLSHGAHMAESQKDLLFVNDRETELGAIITEIKKMAQTHGGVSLIVIDYLQLMHVKGTGDNRNTELGIITRTLRETAKELNCPIILVSQLNRSIEGAERQPRNSDLRDSGSIESDADTITFITRNLNNSNDRQAILHVTKNRFGTTNQINMQFFGEYQSFFDDDVRANYGY